MIKFITKIIQKMAKNATKNAEEKLTISSEQQKQLIDALVKSTRELKRVRTENMHGEQHPVTMQIKENDTLLNSIK